MLLNLSNHPSSSWPTSQMEIAKSTYGEVVEMPFPHIDPLAGLDGVRLQCEQVFNEIKKLDPRAVHIMGELTFTYMLVNILREFGIPCIASTTERIVEEDGDKKISTFIFKQFRPYF